MSFISVIKASAVAASFTFAAGSVGATTVAEFSSTGDFTITNTTSTEVLRVSGAFTASFDPTFDLTESNDFTFAAALSTGFGGTLFDESFEIEAITGEDLIFGAISLISVFGLLDPISAIIAEGSDSDGAQSEIAPGVFLSLDLSSISFGASSVMADFTALLSEEDVTGQPLGRGFRDTYAFDASVSVSPVPLPATLPLLGFGLGLMALRAGRRRAA